MNIPSTPLFNTAATIEDPSAAAGGGGAPRVAFNPDGSFGENWHSALGEEFSAHGAQLGTFKDVRGLAKSYLHLRGTGPSYPGEGASPEDVSRFHALAQVPTEGTAKAYGFKVPEGAPDEVRAEYDAIAAKARELHLPREGFSKLVEWYEGQQQGRLSELQGQHEKVMKAAEDDLIGTWRGDFEANKSIARHWAGKLADMANLGPEDPHVAALLDNPAFAKMMFQNSKLTGEGGIRTPAGFGDLRSPQERANAIMNGTDPVWGAKYTGGNAEHQREAYAEVSRVLAMARR